MPFSSCASIMGTCKHGHSL